MDLFDLRRVGDGGDDDVAGATDLDWLADRPHTGNLARERLGPFEVAGHDRQGEARLREVAGHALAHGPKADKSDRLLHQAPRAGIIAGGARQPALPETLPPPGGSGDRK